MSDVVWLMSSLTSSWFVQLQSIQPDRNTTFTLSKRSRHTDVLLIGRKVL
ncbi:hypothetical protein [Stenotrophomonas indicatrix]|nr:hypothetical protein [Stenotrophomonas indicatrix]MBO1747083.1 hypothetical protein [Stenotrophomonas indicatrix]